ncbi:MAG: hypothetical protein ACRDFZ_08345 [Candidatus Limnocylindria bacterium]
MTNSRRGAGRAVALVAGVGLIVGIGAFLAVGTRALPGDVTPYHGDWFSFDYPERWSVISGYEQCGLHGPMVAAAVGIGGFEVGGIVTPNSVTCPSPTWTVSEDGIVVAYHFGPICCPTPPPPRPILAPGERFVEVDGIEAVLSYTESGVVWHLYSRGPAYIEARWGQHAGNEAKAQVEELVESWEWLPEPTR